MSASGSTRPGRKTLTTPKEADRLWVESKARAIADAVRGQSGTVTEESKPSTQASPLLFDLTSLQREANGKFGFSAKTTLALAQSLYRAPQGPDLPTYRLALSARRLCGCCQTPFEMLAQSEMRHLAPTPPRHSRVGA